MEFIVSSRITLAAIALLAAISCNAEEPAIKSSDWLIGLWYVISDEDEETLGQVFEFLPGGALVLYDNDCDPITPTNELSYRVDRSDIHVTNLFSGGDTPPRTLRISQDKQRLTLTWPNTGKHATFERIPTNECVKQS